MLTLEQQIVQAAKQLTEMGLLIGKSGNLSARESENRIIVTATQKEYANLVPSSLVTLDFESNVVKGRKKPSSELPMHIEIYKRRPGVQSIIHTHATYATALAVARTGLPAIIDESIIKLGGVVNVSEYAVAGTQELASNVAKVLDKKNAALIANHGCVTVGRSVRAALENMILLEHTAKIYVISKAIGYPYKLPENAVTLETDLFKSMFATE